MMLLNKGQKVTLGGDGYFFRAIVTDQDEFGFTFRRSDVSALNTMFRGYYEFESQVVTFEEKNLLERILDVIMVWCGK